MVAGTGKAFKDAVWNKSLDGTAEHYFKNLRSSESALGKFYVVSLQFLYAVRLQVHYWRPQ